MEKGLKSNGSSRKRGRPLGSRKKLNGRRMQPAADAVASAGYTRQTYDEANEAALVQAGEEIRQTPFSMLLRDILRRDRTEIARVAKALEVAENTIYRWMNGSSEPRETYLKKLPDALPTYRTELIEVINASFGNILFAHPEGLPAVGKDIYRRVLELVATIEDDDLRFWQVSEVLFEAALAHLDAKGAGVAMTYAALMPAHADGIHSLRETIMRGTHPWPARFEVKAFLGSTTLAGIAAMLQRAQTWDSQDNSERWLVAVDDFEGSACSCPIVRGGRIAGVLVVSSTQADFFKDAVAIEAVLEYASLMSLALCERDFQPFSSLRLRPMPDLKWQREILSQSYVPRVLRYASEHNISRPEAERQVQREMELEFEAVGHNPSSRTAEQTSISIPGQG